MLNGLKRVSYIVLEEIVAFLVIFDVGGAHTDRIFKCSALLGKFYGLIDRTTTIDRIFR